MASGISIEEGTWAQPDRSRIRICVDPPCSPFCVRQGGVVVCKILWALDIETQEHLCGVLPSLGGLRWCERALRYATSVLRASGVLFSEPEDVLDLCRIATFGPAVTDRCLEGILAASGAVPLLVGPAAGLSGSSMKERLAGLFSRNGHEVLVGRCLSAARDLEWFAAVWNGEQASRRDRTEQIMRRLVESGATIVHERFHPP